MPAAGRGFSFALWPDDNGLDRREPARGTAQRVPAGRNAIVWHKPNAMPESVRDRLPHDRQGRRRLTVNISPAALVRSITDDAPPMLLLDEADTYSADGQHSSTRICAGS